MIFILHYLLFNAGLPSIILLIALFLQTHSDASLSEIGTLLMALPFVGILIKPLFGALADRHNAHRRYMIGGLSLMALGYGSLIVAPFFPRFVQQHGRLVWYLDVLGIIVGYSAFGVTWSLGDALAVNGAQMAGVSWGSYRMWGVISWGIVGIVSAQINELPFLPKYTPALMVLVVSLVAEVVLLALWPDKYFVMCGSLESPAKQSAGATDTAAIVGAMDEKSSTSSGESEWPANRSLTGTSPRMIGAVANIFMEDLGGTLKSSLKLGGFKAKQRKGLGEILEQHQHIARSQSAGLNRDSTADAQTSLALGEAAGNGKALESAPDQNGPLALVAANLAADTLNRSADFQALEQHSPPRAASKSVEDLQLVLLKLIVKRDKTICKYIALFTVFGFLLTCHLSYFYLHLQRLCEEKGNDFKSAYGGMLFTHSISEMLAFILVPRFIDRVGRVGGLLTCSLAYFVRFAYYGTYFVDYSPYTGVPFEFCHGIAYGIVYTLITDVAVECVDQVDEFLPELVERGLVAPDIQMSKLKAALRATMQGVFSGAFDGLGNGMGALFGGVFVDAYSFVCLWQFCALVSLAVMVVYPVAELYASTRRREDTRPARGHIATLQEKTQHLSEAK